MTAASHPAPDTKKASERTSPERPRRWRRFLPHALTAVSALLYVAAFPPWSYSALAPWALIPWVLALCRTTTFKGALREGVWMSFLIGVLGFTWVAVALHMYGPLPWPVSVAGLLIFSLANQPQMVAFAAIFFYLRRLLGNTSPFRLGVAPALALAYAGIDWILPKLFVDTLGHALYNVPIARQAADLGGAPLLSFLLLLVTLAVAGWIERIRLREEPSYWPAIHGALPLTLFTAFLWAAELGYGHWRISTLEALVVQAPVVEAAAIQANIGDFDKVAAEQGIRGAGDKVVSAYIALSQKALEEPRPDFIVWPETAYPSTFRKPLNSDDLFHEQKIERFVKDADVPLLFGGYDRTLTRPELDFNALFALRPDGTMELYQKNILLLFGEYIPLADEFDWIKRAFPTVGNFGHGVGPSVLKVPLEPRQGRGREVRLSPVICYEALFPNYVIAAARQGSQLILNVTNDSWFGPWAEPDQHLALVTFRSVETRLPQLRATNTGISALITPTGEITQATGIGEATVLRARVPLFPAPWTLMKAWGDWFGPFALGAGLMWLFLLFRKRPRPVT